jgi:hypothetical protein
MSVRERTGMTNLRTGGQWIVCPEEEAKRLKRLDGLKGAAELVGLLVSPQSQNSTTKLSQERGGRYRKDDDLQSCPLDGICSDSFSAQQIFYTVSMPRNGSFSGNNQKERGRRVEGGEENWNNEGSKGKNGWRKRARVVVPEWWQKPKRGGRSDQTGGGSESRKHGRGKKEVRASSNSCRAQKGRSVRRRR